MKKPTPKQLEAEIERRNRAFNKATNPQKRVMIARDVIARVKSGQFMAT